MVPFAGQGQESTADAERKRTDRVRVRFEGSFAQRLLKRREDVPGDRAT